MDKKQGKGIVIYGFAGIWRVQIVDFDKGGVPEKISSSFISRKQVAMRNNWPFTLRKKKSTINQ